jgi:hypothetical protein
MTLVGVHCNAEKTEHQLKLWLKNIQHNGQLFKCPVFCVVHGHLIPVRES